MKYLRLALSLLLIVFSGCEPPSPTTKKEKDSDTITETIKIETLVAKLGIARHYAIDNCVLKFELVESVPDMTRVAETGGLAMCKIRLTDPKGNPCRYSEYGASTVGAFAWIGYDANFGALKSGELRTFLYPLEKLFILSPGIWNLEFDINLHKGKLGRPSSRSLPLRFKGIQFTIPD